MTLKEKIKLYNTGNYICVGYKWLGVGRWVKLDTQTFQGIDDVCEWQVIHKDHEHILNAYLKDNSAEIEVEYSPKGEKNWWNILASGKFIELYSPDNKYRLKSINFNGCWCEATQEHYDKLVKDGYTLTSEWTKQENEKFSIHVSPNFKSFCTNFIVPNRVKQIKLNPQKEWEYVGENMNDYLTLADKDSLIKLSDPLKESFEKPKKIVKETPKDVLNKQLKACEEMNDKGMSREEWETLIKVLSTGEEDGNNADNSVVYNDNINKYSFNSSENKVNPTSPVNFGFEHKEGVEILKKVGYDYIGYIMCYDCERPFPVACKWNKNGILANRLSNPIDGDLNLKTLKSKWYEVEDNKGKIIAYLDEKGEPLSFCFFIEYNSTQNKIQAFLSEDLGYYEDVSEFRPATEQEIQSLLVEVE